MTNPINEKSAPEGGAVNVGRPIVAEGSTPAAAAGAGWFPIARADQRKILAQPTPHRNTALVVWVELLQYANYRRATRFDLALLTIADRTHIGRTTVKNAVVDLQNLKLLSHSSVRGKDGKHESTRFVLKPSVSPFRVEPCAENEHGSPCAENVRQKMRTLKHGESETLSPSENKKDGEAFFPGVVDAGAGPPSERKPEERRGSWL